MKQLLYIWVLSLFFVACSDDDNETVCPPNTSNLTDIPPGFPPIDYPEDNTFTQARWDLGKRLFFDPIMSVDSTISCGSCHLPDQAFSDVTAVSIGAGGELGTRNSPTLANVAYLPYFTREGGVPTLEMQILVPIQEHNEFNSNIVEISEKLNEIPSYVADAQAAYNRDPDAYVITRALANFERTLISGNSRYDQYLQGNAGALTASELNGMNLFFSEETQCSNCHGGFNFTESALENNGLYEVYEDPGRYRLTGAQEDIGVFKVPTLRNVELTAPYMHDGSVPSLEDVVNHYLTGGSNHPNKSELLTPLDLSSQEQTDLVNFLKTLTDWEFASKDIFANPN